MEEQETKVTSSAAPAPGFQRIWRVVSGHDLEKACRDGWIFNPDRPATAPARSTPGSMFGVPSWLLDKPEYLLYKDETAEMNQDKEHLETCRKENAELRERLAPKRQP